MTEARKIFHRDLGDVQQELVRISAGVVESIPKCTAVLLEQDLAGAETMIMADDEIDARTIDLEDRCIQILALQAPVAGELRQVISALKICAEIERSADMDSFLDDLQRQFIQAIFESHAAGRIDLQVAIQLAVVARFYERIGDHAVNIGEKVRFQVTGLPPDHSGAARHRQRVIGDPTPLGGIARPQEVPPTSA